MLDEGFTYDEVDGAYSDDGVTEVRLKYIERVPFDRIDPNEADEPPPVAAAPKVALPKLDEALSALLTTGDLDSLVDVHVVLATTFTISLRGASGTAEAASLIDAEQYSAKRARLIAARKAEAAAAEEAVLEKLRELGAVEAGGLWLAPGIGASMPRAVSNFSNQGGAGATINGVLRPAAMSLMSALAPRCVAYSFSSTVNDGIVTRTSQCGSSISTPQIAGAGVLVKGDGKPGPAS